jgi:hypothetical protein
VLWRSQRTAARSAAEKKRLAELARTALRWL